MMGYLLDENEFKVTPAISRGIAMFENISSSHLAPYQLIASDEEGTININIHFTPGINIFNLSVENGGTYDEIYMENVANSTILLNSAPVTIPFMVADGDTLKITIVKNDVTKNAYMTLKGIIE